MITVAYLSVIMTNATILVKIYFTTILLWFSFAYKQNHLLSTFCFKYIFYAHPAWFQMQKLMTAVWWVYNDNDTQLILLNIYLQLTRMSIKVLIYWEIILGAARPLTFASFSEKANKTKRNNTIATAIVLASQ